MADRIELSPSGRSRCRACQKNIEKGDVRLGVAVPNPFGEGQATHYYHLECGAWRQPNALLAAALGVQPAADESATEAQSGARGSATGAQSGEDERATGAQSGEGKEGGEAKAEPSAEPVDRAAWEGIEAERRKALLAAAEVSREHHRLRRFVKVERAKTARAHCRHCRETIDKGALRLCLEIIEDGRADAAGFVHLGCARAYAGPVEHVLPHLARAEGVTDADFTEVEQVLSAP